MAESPPKERGWGRSGISKRDVLPKEKQRSISRQRRKNRAAAQKNRRARVTYIIEKGPEGLSKSCKRCPGMKRRARDHQSNARGD